MPAKPQSHRRVASSFGEKLTKVGHVAVRFVAEEGTNCVPYPNSAADCYSLGRTQRTQRARAVSAAWPTTNNKSNLMSTFCCFRRYACARARPLFYRANYVATPTPSARFGKVAASWKYFSRISTLRLPFHSEGDLVRDCSVGICSILYNPARVKQLVNRWEEE